MSNDSPTHPRRIAPPKTTVIVWILLLPVLLHTAFSAVPAAGSYAVLTSSMEPTIDAGDVVYTYDTGDYEAGDVITYRHDGRLITHRVVAADAGSFRTRGDANDSPDEYRVSEDMIVGEVVLHLPYLGRLIAANVGLYLGGALLAIYAFATLYGVVQSES